MTPTAQDQDRDQIPEAVRRYQEAHDHHATETALSAFTPDATVTDENRTYQGTDQIRHWLDAAATEFTYTRTFVTALETAPDTWVVVNHLEGDFPGGRVDLRYQYTLTAGLISALAIAPGP
jgi:ketosteroid isomerase-like protein